jgi:hypothetical protein
VSTCEVPAVTGIAAIFMCQQASDRILKIFSVLKVEFVLRYDFFFNIE